MALTLLCGCAGAPPLRTLLINDGTGTLLGRELFGLVDTIEPAEPYMTPEPCQISDTLCQIGLEVARQATVATVLIAGCGDHLLAAQVVAHRLVELKPGEIIRFAAPDAPGRMGTFLRREVRSKEAGKAYCDWAGGSVGEYSGGLACGGATPPTCVSARGE